MGKRIILLIYATVLLSGLLTACRANTVSEKISDNNKNMYNVELSEEEQKLCGSWAYIHDKETAAVIFNEDGSAEYRGEEYSYSCDGQFISLTDNAEETLTLRYVLDEAGMYLYNNNIYTYDGEGSPDGLVGEWTCKEDHWTFSFTKEGTFMEDGYFTGYYSVDSAKSCFTLVYEDQFEDTVCYFRLEEKKLYIEYPWRMVHTV